MTPITAIRISILGFKREFVCRRRSCGNRCDGYVVLVLAVVVCTISRESRDNKICIFFYYLFITVVVYYIVWNCTSLLPSTRTQFNIRTVAVLRGCNYVFTATSLRFRRTAIRVWLGRRATNVYAVRDVHEDNWPPTKRMIVDVRVYSINYRSSARGRI